MITLSADAHVAQEKEAATISLAEAQRVYAQTAAEQEQGELVATTVMRVGGMIEPSDTFDLESRREVINFFLNKYSVFEPIDGQEKQNDDYPPKLNKLPEDQTLVGKVSVAGYHELMNFFESKDEIPKQAKKLPEYLYVVWDNASHQLKFVSKKKHESFYEAYKTLFGGDVFSDNDWTEDWNPIEFIQGDSPDGNRLSEDVYGAWMINKYLDVPSYKDDTDEMDFADTYFSFGHYQWQTNFDLTLSKGVYIQCSVMPTNPYLVDQPIDDFYGKILGEAAVKELEVRDALHAKYQYEVLFYPGSRLIKIPGILPEQIKKDPEGDTVYYLTEDQRSAFFKKVDQLQRF
jgi:hypothetical protein